MSAPNQIIVAVALAFIIYLETETKQSTMTSGPKQNVAAIMLQETALKKMLEKTAPKKNNPELGLLPRNYDSCFGDFPAGSRPKANPLVLQNTNLTAAEQSTAVAVNASK